MRDREPTIRSRELGEGLRHAMGRAGRTRRMLHVQTRLMSCTRLAPCTVLKDYSTVLKLVLSALYVKVVYMSQSPAEGAELLTSGTAAGLYTFLDIAIKRGDIGHSTGIALRSASKKVLDLEEDHDLELRSLDQEDLLRRFHIKSKVDLNDQSRARYESRFRRAVEMYLKYLANDPSWKPAPSKSHVSTQRATTSRPTAAPTAPSNATATHPLPRMIEFPIPLRPGVQGKLVLPDDLTKKEAERVVRVVSALAIEEPLSPPTLTGDA